MLRFAFARSPSSLARLALVAAAFAGAALACGDEPLGRVAPEPEFEEDQGASPVGTPGRDASSSTFEGGLGRDAGGATEDDAGDGGRGATRDASVDAGPPPILGTYTARVNGTTVKVTSAVAKYTAIADLVDVEANIVLPSGSPGKISLRVERLRTGCDGSTYVSTSGPSFGFINLDSDCGLTVTRFSKVAGQRIAATFDGTVRTAQNVSPRSAAVVFAFDLEVSP